MSQKEMHVWTVSGTLTEYGASLVAKIPELERRMDFLFDLLRSLQEQIVGLLEPKAEQLIRDFFNVNPKIVYRRFTSFISSLDNNLLARAMHEKWDEMFKSGQIIAESVKTERGGYIRYYRLKEG